MSSWCPAHGCRSGPRHIGSRLIRQTRYHATKAYWDRERRAHLYNPLETEVTGAVGDLRLRGRPVGHPDFVLVRLIIDTTPPPKEGQRPKPVHGEIIGRPSRRQHDSRTEGQRLKAIDAELVARTRLERIWSSGSASGLRKTIEDAAAEVDKIEGGEVGKKRRQRAEAIIIRELTDHRRPSRRPGAGVEPSRPAPDGPAPAPEDQAS